MRYLMTFSYDGTNYNGYQKQPNKNTIQDQVENAFFKIFNKEIVIHASGRTDAKVHAINQKAHFDLDKEVDIEKLKHSINSLTNDDIFIKKIEKVDDNFHARFNVIEKIYIYKINLGDYNPIDRNYVFQYNKQLDISKMDEASKYLIGTHCFKSFTKVNEEISDFVRTIYEIKFTCNNDILQIEFRGNGFLRYMVRNLVGTLLQVGSNKINPIDMKIILEEENRIYAGKTINPEGLYLFDVKYE